MVEELQKKFPGRSIRLFISEPLGTNPKAATLHTLAAEARGDVLAICDADVRVSADFLRRVVEPLANPAIGMVTCLYRGEVPANVPARLEALHMDAAFAPSVALAWKLGTDVGLGAAVIMRREDCHERAGMRESPTTCWMIMRSPPGCAAWASHSSERLSGRQRVGVPCNSVSSGPAKFAGRAASVLPARAGIWG